MANEGMAADFWFSLSPIVFIMFLTGLLLFFFVNIIIQNRTLKSIERMTQLLDSNKDGE